MVKREDLRQLTVCSVDPPGCTDIDDALHCRELDNGNLEVHIFYMHARTQTHYKRSQFFLFKYCCLPILGGRPHCWCQSLHQTWQRVGQRGCKPRHHRLLVWQSTEKHTHTRKQVFATKCSKFVPHYVPDCSLIVTIYSECNLMVQAHLITVVFSKHLIMNQARLFPKDFSSHMLCCLFPSEDRHGSWAAQLQSLFSTLQRGPVSTYIHTRTSNSIMTADIPFHLI